MPEPMNAHGSTQNQPNQTTQTTRLKWLVVRFGFGICDFNATQLAAGKIANNK